MKSDIINVYDHAIKRLKHGFPTNAHRKFILPPPRSTNALSRFADSVIYRIGLLAEFTGAFIAKPYFNLAISHLHIESAIA